MSAAASTKKKGCPACGNNPTPHFFNWYASTVDIFFSDFRRVLFYNSFITTIEKWIVALPLWRWVVKLLEALHIVTYTTDRTLCCSPRAGVLWEEAEKRGIHFRAAQLFGRTLDIYVVEKDNKKISFMGLPRPMNDGKTLEILDDKWEMKKRFRAAGIPTPDGASVTSWNQAVAAFERITKPVIVKPRTGSRGRHTTTYISSLADLRPAFEQAKKLCRYVIIEEHLVGPVYRGTVIDYQLQGVLRGDAPSVVGDGVHTISELVLIKNATPHMGASDIVVNAGTEVFLARQGLTSASIPKNQQEVFLSEKVGVSYGGSSSEEFDICHPDTKEVFVTAAKVMGDSVLGFDFIIPDITVSYRDQRAGFIECNSLPFISLHHHPLKGIPRNVAAAVWDLAGFPSDVSLLDVSR